MLRYPYGLVGYEQGLRTKMEGLLCVTRGGKESKRVSFCEVNIFEVNN